MTTTIGRRAVVAALLGACAGCGSADGSLVYRESLAGVHDYGVTPCPQDLGAIEVELGAGATAPATLTVSEEILSIDVLDPELAWPINPGWSITIEPGQVLVFPVQFNCGSVDDVSGSIVIETTPRGGSTPIDTASIPLALDIQGAP